MNVYFEAMDKTERILHAALELIIERGLERTPMSMIADRAEVGMERFTNT